MELIRNYNAYLITFCLNVLFTRSILASECDIFKGDQIFNIQLNLLNWIHYCYVQREKNMILLIEIPNYCKSFKFNSQKRIYFSIQI